MNSPFYDSDEEVAWGPITLRELKKHMEKEDSNISYRYSDRGVFHDEKVKIKDYPVIDKASFSSDDLISEDVEKSPILQPDGTLDKSSTDESMENCCFMRKSSLGSSTSTISLHLDDTMEEIELALKEGLNYRISDETTQETVEEPIEETPKKLDIPAVPKTPSVKPKVLNTPKNKSLIPINKKYKDIVSPLHLYINNRPNFFLKKTVDSQAKPELKNISVLAAKNNDKTKSVKKEDKESFVLPKVFYKPSKKKIVVANEENRLPMNIKKHLPNGIISKNEKKTGKTILSDSVADQLFENDVSNLVLNDTKDDISFISNKLAFIK